MTTRHYALSTTARNGEAGYQIRTPKYLPCEIQPLAGQHGGNPQDEQEINPKF
jgi:hypothetical protein